MPASAARRASSGCWIPFSAIGPCQCSRRNARSSQVRAGFPNVAAHWRTAGPRRSSSTSPPSVPLEDGVGEVVLVADALEERKERAVEIARAPAHRVRVEGHDERAVAGGRRALEEAHRELAILRPVELVPAGTVARRPGDVLERRRRGRADDEREADARGRAGDRRLAVRVDDRQHPDRREQRRARASASPARSRTCRARRRPAAFAARASTRRRPPGSRARSTRSRRRPRRTRTTRAASAPPRAPRAA